MTGQFYALTTIPMANDGLTPMADSQMIDPDRVLAERLAWEQGNQQMRRISRGGAGATVTGQTVEGGYIAITCEGDDAAMNEVSDLGYDVYRKQ